LELNNNTNFYSQQEVDNFNNKVKRYNELIAAYNKEIASYKSLEATYNSHVTQHNSVVNKFQSECAGKRYYEDDFVAASSNINK
jgi:wobble nucleotide-excising tRNase